MTRPPAAEITMDPELTATEGMRYRSGLAEELLASEQSVLRLITRNTPLPELLAEVCRRAEALLGSGASCTILLLDSDGTHVKVHAAPSLPENYRIAIDGTLIGPKAGSCGTAIHLGQVVIVEDIATDPLWEDYRDLALPIGLRACWSIPFEGESGSVIGAFAVYHRTVRRPTDEEETILRDISHSVGLAIHQDTIARRLAQSEEQHRLVVTHLREGIVVQSREGIVLACNPSAQRMLHTTDLLGRDISSVMRRARDENGELSLVYQPVVDSRMGQTVGAEALLRWYNSELGQVSPTEFIPVAEDTGLIVSIGRWVLERACMQAAEWRRTIAPDLVMAVNLSPRQFNDRLVECVECCLALAGLAPEGLELEITEGLLMGDTETLLPMLTALADMGVRISVDDFGTGYSSLSYLKRFPLHNLKVDRSFVAGLPEHRDSVAITQAVVAMAHSLGMNVTAEGVETLAQASFLSSIGCDKQQGYLFSRPVEALAYERAWVRAMPS